jgi:hypothetical protein
LFAEDPTKSIVSIRWPPDSIVSLQLRTPVERTITAKLADLVHDNVVEFTGVFTSESLILGRLIGPQEYTARIRWNDRRPAACGTDWYYVRVTQHNGHCAWSSPIWVG